MYKAGFPQLYVRLSVFWLWRQFNVKHIWQLCHLGFSWSFQSLWYGTEHSMLFKQWLKQNIYPVTTSQIYLNMLTRVSDAPKLFWNKYVLQIVWFNSLNVCYQCRREIVKCHDNVFDYFILLNGIDVRKLILVYLNPLLYQPNCIE